MGLNFNLERSRINSYILSVLATLPQQSSTTTDFEIKQDELGHYYSEPSTSTSSVSSAEILTKTTVRTKKTL